MDLSINIRVEWGIFKDLNDTNIAIVTFIFDRLASLECKSRLALACRKSC